MTPPSFGQLVRQQRQAMELTVEALARRAGCPQSTIRAIECGRFRPSPQLAERLAELLRIVPEERLLFVQAAGLATPLTMADLRLPGAAGYAPATAPAAELAPARGHELLPVPILQRLPRAEQLAFSQTYGVYHRESWGEAPDVESFQGRQAELQLLKQWTLHEQCRVVGVLGMGGMGKTSLVSRLAHIVKDLFDVVFWCSLLNAPPLEQQLADCLALFSDEQRGPDRLDRSVSRLLHYLRHYRCLLIFDNAESILRGGGSAGHYLPGYESYGYLLRQLGEAPHHGCLLLTSREKPRDLALLESADGPVRSFQLAGLPQAEARGILAGKQLDGSDESWRQLIERYDGNPLAIKLVGETIREIYDGNIGAFIQAGQVIVGDIRDVLDQQFSRLEPLEQELLLWLALAREPLGLEDLGRDLLAPMPAWALQQALTSLRRRCWVERHSAGFLLQNVVIEYLTARLIAQVAEELREGVCALVARHALIKAQAKDYLREMQTRLTLRPILGLLRAALGDERAVEQRLATLADTLRGQPALAASYAAGNLLNLLAQLRGRISGHNFSALSVRQAYLRGIDLHDLSFAGCDLSSSVFTETFGAILSVALSPDGRLLAAGTSDGDLCLWQLYDRQLLWRQRAHSDWLRALAFSPDSTLLASAGDDELIHLWSLQNQRREQTLRGHSGRVLALAFRPGAAQLLSAGEDHSLRVWDIASGTPLQLLQGHSSWVCSLACSADGRTLASGSRDQTVRLWDLASGECLRMLPDHETWIWSVAFSPDGQTLASAGEDRLVRVWDVATGACLQILRGHQDGLHILAFSPDGQTLASGSVDHSIRLWDPRGGQCTHLLQGHTKWVRSLAFSPDGRTLASGSNDQSVRLWDVATGHCLYTLQGYASRAGPLAFSADGATIAVAAGEGVRLWDPATGHAQGSIPGHHDEVLALAAHPHEPLLATSSDHGIRLWDVRAAALRQLLRGHFGRVRSLAFSPDGRTLASSSEDSLIRLWEVATGEPLRTLQGHAGWVWSVAFSPDGQTLASGGDDQTVCLWDLATGQRQSCLIGHSNSIWSVAFSPDGSLLASGCDDQTLRLWDPATGECLHVLQGHQAQVWSVAFSPDGQTLASASADQTLRLWDSATGACLRVLQGHADRVRSLAFSPDGRTLASSSYDQTVRLWDPVAGESLRVLRRDGPYARLNIAGASGLSEVQRAMLRALGAVE